jgi:hypothetical protein
MQNRNRGAKSIVKNHQNFHSWSGENQKSTNALNMVDCVWNVMANAQKPDFVFRRKERVHLNRWGGGGPFSRLLAAGGWASAVGMLDTPCSEVVWRVLATHYIRQFPLHFPSRASPCTITFKLASTYWHYWNPRLLSINVTRTQIATIVEVGD